MVRTPLLRGSGKDLFTAIPTTKLTEAFIRNLACEDKPYVLRDTIIKGLMVAVNKHSKSYKVQRDLWVGQRGRRRQAKTMRHTLGTTVELTLDAVRTHAMEVIAQIKQGVDPNAPAGAASLHLESPREGRGQQRVSGVQGRLQSGTPRGG